jgi:hypothetical protein
MGGRLATLAGMVGLALGALVSHASASHHLVRIAEVSPGTLTAVNDEYVQLEMISGGQQFFQGTGAAVRLYAATGMQTLSVPVSTNVDNGERGRRVLVGLAGMSPTPDFAFSAGDYLAPAGGAACFRSNQFPNIDCVSWGSFTGMLPSSTGGNAPAIGDDLSLVRKRRSCGPDLIDTNSPSNLAQATPNPMNNADPQAAGAPCPDTRITKKPKKKTTKRVARFEFRATPPSQDFACKLDRTPLRDCDSPFRKRVGRGEHTFKVRAAGDPSPAAYAWKVVKKRR